MNVQCKQICTLRIESGLDDWFSWAVKNSIPEDVVGYLTFAKKDLYDFDPRNPETLATLVKFAQLLEDDDDEATPTDLVSGPVREGLGLKFMAHRKGVHQSDYWLVRLKL